MIKKLVRKTCLGFEPYVAGKPVETIKRELGLKSVIKMASNENPLGASSKAIKAIKENIEKIFFYPDSNSYLLKQALSKRYRLPAGNIFTAAGGDEIIELIAKVFFNPEDEIVYSKHSFIRYGMAAKLMGSKAVVVPMKEGFTHDLKAMAKACGPKTKAVFITNPNNPTGTYNTKSELSKFLKDLPENNFEVKPIVILDEAYYEYAKIEKDYPDGLTFLKDNQNLIVFRTFSKIYGLAGLRVGYGFANAAIADFIERTRPPFNVNLLAQVAAAAAIDDLEQVKKSQKLVKAEKAFLYKEFAKLKVPFLKSAANFILFNCAPLKGKEFFTRMLKEGIITRPMDEYDLPDWVRVTVGLHKENVLFVEKLKKTIR
ncbi:MAG: histidinol-phosphate transaminase [Endomicrobia bacterium]|nr:histidinol-phosphate transaminase [Endomicrobiia bacterium]MCL2799584.1 histidinol-phosphate transaminase [Endomicrobiia bacterium]